MLLNLCRDVLHIIISDEVDADHFKYVIINLSCYYDHSLRNAWILSKLYRGILQINIADDFSDSLSVTLLTFQTLYELRSLLQASTRMVSE